MYWAFKKKRKKSSRNSSLSEKPNRFFLMERTLARYLSIKFLFIACLRDETEEIKENTVCNGIQWWWIIYLYLQDLFPLIASLPRQRSKYSCSVLQFKKFKKKNKWNVCKDEMSDLYTKIMTINFKTILPFKPLSGQFKKNIKISWRHISQDCKMTDWLEPWHWAYICNTRKTD